MNRASISCFGRSRDSDLLLVVGLDSGQVKPMTCKIDTCHLLPSQVLGIIKIGKGLVGSVSGYCDSVGYQVIVLAAWSPSWEAI